MRARAACAVMMIPSAVETIPHVAHVVPLVVGAVVVSDIMSYRPYAAATSATSCRARFADGA